MVDVAIFVLGWVVYVLVQAQNSIRSSTNGLQGAAGWKLWFKGHAVDLVTRAFFSGIFYRYIVFTTEQKLKTVGFIFEASTIAGLGGFLANALLYQIIGLIPGLRVEVADLAPPEQPPSLGRITN